MINEFIDAFFEWRGDKEIAQLGLANKDEINRVKNWKFKDYYNNERNKKAMQGGEK